MAKGSTVSPVEVPEPKVDYALGCDLGQTTDPTALCVIERTEQHTGAYHQEPEDWVTWAIMETTYRCRHLERLPLQTPYPVVVDQLKAMMNTAPLRGNCRLIVDQTGVGRPVVDMLRDAKLRPEAVTITSGDREHKGDQSDEHRVSKLVLVSRLQAMLHSGRLKIAKGIPEAEALRSELADFRVSFTEGTGTARFGARVGKHDDLVLAAAIAAWWIGKPKMRVGMFNTNWM